MASATVALTLASLAHAQKSFSVSYYQGAQLKASLLPIFLADPLEIGDKTPPIVELQVDAKGEPLSARAIYAPDPQTAALIEEALMSSRFNPASYAGVPAASMIRFAVTQYAVVREPTGAEVVPPLARWWLESDVSARMVDAQYMANDFSSLSRRDVDLSLSVDETGALAHVQGRGTTSEKLARHLDDNRANVVFKPLRIGDVPQFCELRVRLLFSQWGRPPQFPEGLFSTEHLPEFSLASADDTMPSRIELMLQVAPDGVPVAVLASPSVSVDVAKVAFAFLGHWRFTKEDAGEGGWLPVHFERAQHFGPSEDGVEVDSEAAPHHERYVLAPGNPSEKVRIEGPVVVRQGPVSWPKSLTWPPAKVPYIIFAKAEWRVGADGTMSNLTFPILSHKEFGVEISEASKNWAFEPAQVEGTAVESRMEQWFVSRRAP